MHNSAALFQCVSQYSIATINASITTHGTGWERGSRAVKKGGNFLWHLGPRKLALHWNNLLYDEFRGASSLGLLVCNKILYILKPTINKECVLKFDQCNIQVCKTNLNAWWLVASVLYRPHTFTLWLYSLQLVCRDFYSVGKATHSSLHPQSTAFI